MAYVIPGKGYINPGKGVKQVPKVKPRAATDRTVVKPAVSKNEPSPSASSYGPTSRVTNKKLEDKAIGRLVGQSELDAIRKKAAEEAAAAAAAAAGGGGGGRNPLNDYTQQLQKLLTSGSYANPYDDLMKKFQGLFNQQKSSLVGINEDADITINDSMDSLETMLKGQANPYADLKAENVTPTAQLSSFLQGQNVSDQQTQDYAQVLNAQNAGSAGAFNNLANFMRGIADSNQQGAITDVGVQRDASNRQLANNFMAAEMNIDKSSMNDQRDIEKLKTTQQGDLIKQLMAAIAKGGVPKKGRLF